MIDLLIVLCLAVLLAVALDRPPVEEVQLELLEPPQSSSDSIDDLVHHAIRRGMPRRTARALAHRLRTGGRPRQKGHSCK